MSDISYTPQFSSDLINWSSATVLVTSAPNADGSVTETWRPASPVAASARLYVRVRVQ